MNWGKGEREWYIRSRLAIVVSLTGWVVIVVYLLYEYSEYGNELLGHFLTPRGLLQHLFHLLVLAAPVASTITGYLIEQRTRLLEKVRTSEETLRRASREWAVIFDSMPYGVMLVDKDFNIRRVNRYISELSGISIRDLLSDKRCYEIIHRTDSPPEACPLRKAMESQRPERIELYEPAYKRYFMANIVPLYKENGRADLYINSIVDITEAKEYEQRLRSSKDALFNITQDLNAAHKELQALYQGIVLALANAIDAKSPWTKGHSERVTNYALAIAKEMDIDSKKTEALRIAGLLHDIGKISIDNIILDKPDRLTKEEFELVKGHPIKAEEILSPIKGLEEITPIIRWHHERLDGTGYPDGLKNDDIPLLARILCVADSYDSMITDRPYRPSPGKEYAISEFKRCAGTQFDPHVVEAFLSILERSGDEDSA